MSSYVVSDTSLTAVADAIREKGGTSGTLEFPDGFVRAVEEMEAGITPAGTLTITENGTVDVSQYAAVNVQVDSEAGMVKFWVDDHQNLCVTTYDGTNGTDVSFEIVDHDSLQLTYTETQ